jgi:dipeptidyl-peptidase-3
MKKLFAGMSIVIALSGLTHDTEAKSTATQFQYVVDQFADLQILRYRVPGFETLPLREKELIYYLNQAALEGRDIIYDQNDRHNLCIRRTLEAVYQYGKADKTSADFKAFETYLKRVWVSNGIHHHYGSDKFVPGFSQAFFRQAVLSVPANALPLAAGQSPEQLVETLTPLLFDPSLDAKRVNLADGQDLLKTSACNYYQGLTQAAAEAFYGAMKDPKDKTPISYGLNSRLVMENGQPTEKVWKTDGLYGAALQKIVYWLEKAVPLAENAQQKAVIEKLIEYYRSGDLRTFDQYAILWVGDLQSKVDFVNGFTETYGDPLGLKGSWESIVNFKNETATQRTETISSNAQWFEDHSPIDPSFRKEKVKGVSAKVINACILAGDCYPTTPIGINLPNSDWVRRDHGSKSVTIENITEAYDKASQGNGFNEAFMWSPTELKRTEKYGYLTDNLHTDLHECLGHGSGKLLPGVDPDALKAYGSTIEEARADLFGLYYLADPKLVELKLTPNKEAFKAEYYKYILNGLMTQLVRIEPGKNIEESHMRNRALIAYWCLEHGAADKVIEWKKRDGKTFVVINDYTKLRHLFGQLLAVIQRIKSTGDYAGAQQLVETYGVRVDPVLHQEVRERYAALHLAPYKGFVNPVYTPVYDSKGRMTDVRIDYSEGYAEQHLRYSNEFRTLPTYN